MLTFTDLVNFTQLISNRYVVRKTFCGDSHIYELCKRTDINIQNPPSETDTLAYEDNFANHRYPKVFEVDIPDFLLRNLESQ